VRGGKHGAIAHTLSNVSMQNDLEKGSIATKLGSIFMALIHGWERERFCMQTLKFHKAFCELLALSNITFPEL